MNCPHCDRYTADDSTTCMHCGADLRSVQEQQMPQAEPIPLERRFKNGFAVIIIAGVVFALVVFFMSRGKAHTYVTDFPKTPVNLATLIEAGKTNIVDIYSEFCPPCRAIAPLLEKLDAKRSDIHVVRVDINRKGHQGIDWGSPVARQFKLKSIPYFIIIDEHGKVESEGKPAYQKVVALIRKELQ